MEVDEKNTRIGCIKELRKMSTQARWTMIDVENKFRQLYSSTSTSNNSTRKVIDDAQHSIALVEENLNNLLSKLGVKNVWS